MIVNIDSRKGGSSSRTYYRARYKQDESVKLDYLRRKAFDGKAIKVITVVI